jgi:hypothetical protein
MRCTLNFQQCKQPLSPTLCSPSIVHRDPTHLVLHANAFGMHKPVQIYEDSTIPIETPLSSHCTVNKSVERWIESLPERGGPACIWGQVDENFDLSSRGSERELTEDKGRTTKRRILRRLQINGMDPIEERKRRRSPQKHP